jgi:hypothetical protein
MWPTVTVSGVRRRAEALMKIGTAAFVIVTLSM